MKTNRVSTVSLFALITWLASMSHLHGQNTVFTYQGRVLSGGVNFNGAGQFKFALVTSTNFNHQARATAVVNSGFITSYNVTDGGSGYVSAPDVTISGGGGSGAAAIANLSGGIVVSLAVNNVGSGYTSGAPTVTIAPPPPNISYATYWSNDGTSNAGSEPASSVTVGVSNGLFLVVLGDTAIANMTAISASLFAQPNLQLRIWFNDGVNGFAALSPAQNLTPTPYAMMANSANNLLGTLSASQLTGTLPATQLSGTLALAQLPSQVITNNQSGLTLSGTFSGAGTMSWQVASGTTQQAQPNTGYLLTNDALVTVTLPVSPNVGDILRVVGRGAGGWRIAQNPGQSVFGENRIGEVWTPHESNRYWTCVASSADGTKLVAGEIAQNNFGALIYTSTDSGVTWTPRDSVRIWTSVASSADGSKLVAATFPGLLVTSTDAGLNWTGRDVSRHWNAVASSADGTKLVAVVTDSGQIYTSIDSGVTWTPRAGAPSANWISVASSADGAKLVAVGGQVYTSTDSGTNWTPRGLGGRVASSADGVKLVAAGYGGLIYTSTNSGVTWTPCAGAPSTNWLSVASSADGTKLVAGVNGGQIYTSTDAGLTWTAHESSRPWRVACSADGTKLVAPAYGSQIYTSAPRAVPGTTSGTAGYLQGSPNAAIELQYIGNGQFIPISYSGTILAF